MLDAFLNSLFPDSATPSLLHGAGVAMAFLLAGAVKGITGMGLPTVGMSLLGLWMAPARAAGLLVAPSLLTNVAQCQGAYWRGLVVRLWPIWLGMILATVLMPSLADLPVGSHIDGRLMLGVILIVYGAWGLWRPALPDLSGLERRRMASLGLLTGLMTGTMTAWTGVFVFPVVPLLQALRLGKDEMIQALGLTFTVATLALTARLQRSGDMVWWRWDVLLALAFALVGLWVGGRVRARLSGPAFQRGLFLTFMALGAANLIHR